MVQIVLSVINDYTGDQRVQRIANSLQKQGYMVSIIARELPDSLPVTHFPYPIKRLKLWQNKGKLFYIEFMIRLFWKLLRTPATVLVANDLDTLLPNFLAARFKRISLVYDSHEYFTECPEIIRRPFIQKIWKLLEKTLFPRLQYIYTVNDSIANIYTNIYHRPVATIRNLPFRNLAPNYDLATRKLQKVLLYQGALNEGRGLELLIETLRLLPDYQLWIIGKGDIAETLRESSKDVTNIKFLGFKSPSELRELTPKALLGFSLEEDLGGNYHYASPNKLVDYVQAHVPVICSDLPEMKSLCYIFNIGKVLPFSERTAQNLALFIEEMTKNEGNYQVYVENCKIASEKLCWEVEEGKLIEFYRKVVAKFD